MGARPLLRRKRALLLELFDIALDCRAVNVEPTGGLALGDALSYRLHYLFAQVYRIGFHLPMMPAVAISSQDAVKGVMRSSHTRLSWKFASWLCRMPVSRAAS